jgi:hypothetical protein
MNEITIPKRLEPIVKAFFAESPKTAKALIVQAAKAIYGSDEDNLISNFDVIEHKITNEEVESICSLMGGIKPQDVLEALIAAQIVVSHMLGMRKLAKGGLEDSRIGLKLLQFSNEALYRLQKKRSGGMQNITVNYNYVGLPQKPTIISHGEVAYAS